MLALAIGQASAATTTSVAVESTFDSGAEGWTTPANEQSSLLGGLCIEGATCPRVTHESHATGGFENSGFIESKEGGVLAVGLLAETKGSWESPEFTFLGVAGQRPTKVEFSLARRAQLSNLLALSGAQATYSVELVDKTTPSGSVVVVNGATLAGAEEWKSASTAISPDLLTKGDNYRVRIRTTFVTPAAVIPAGGVGYDNVVLTASRDEAEEGPEGPAGPAGPGGSDGNGGTIGSGIGTAGNNGSSAGNPEGSGGSKSTESQGGPSLAELREAISSQGLAPIASLRGGRLTITGMCPKSVDGACTVRIKGMLTKTKVATSSGRAKIARGGKHRFVVAVNSTARKAVKQKGKLLVKEWVRVGSTRVVLYKQLKVVAK